jgi:hypothetical protein
MIMNGVKSAFALVISRLARLAMTSSNARRTQPFNPTEVAAMTTPRQRVMIR